MPKLRPSGRRGSSRVIVVAAALLSAPIAAFAQAPVAACLAHAERIEAGAAPSTRIVFDPDPEPMVEKAAGVALGNQKISDVALGSGGRRRPDGETTSFLWTCLLDERGRAAFVHVRPDPSPRALAECWRWAASRPAVGDCLDAALIAAERELEAVEAKALADARALDLVTGRTRAAAAVAASAVAWIAYREAECGRIAELAAGGSGSGDFFRACLVDGVRARVAELLD